MRRIKIIIAILLFAFCKISFSQIYPVQLNAQLIPPYSGYLPDYADPSSEKLKIILQFNDLTTPQYNIRLRIEIKGNGFSLITKQLFNPPPINLQSGVPLLLSGADLAPYLNSNNLDFIGINQNQYEQRMALPEGYYSICVKAYDYYNPGNIQVSNESCSQAWFLLNDPPFLNLPQCGKNVVPQTPQNIVFQWTPMSMSSPNSAMNTEYEFALWEVRPDSSANPNQVVLSTAPIFSTTTNLTILNYGIAEPPLNLYMKYVWRVRAKDITGRDWFKNNGYSQICTFVYGNLQTVLGNALNLSLTAEGVTHRLGKCTWNTQNIFTKYLLQVRKSGTQNWFDYNCTVGFEKVNNLEPNTTYEARVRGEGSFVGDWSNIATFNTSNEPNYSCNDQTLYADILAAQPLPANRATIGLVIQTGQFEVITTQIAPSGPPGWYSGKGYAKVFGLLPLAVQFNNIYIDDNNRHQQGVIQALTQGINNWVNQWDVKDAEENSTYINGADSVYVNGNQICVKIQGKITDSCFAFPPNQNVIVIRDDQGNQWTVNVNPPPPTVTGPTNYLQFSNDELDASDSTLVEFKQSPNQQYGFDEKKYTAWTNNYELIKLKNGKNYFVPYKSVKEFSNDEVYAKIDIKGFVPGKLSFKTDNSFELTKTEVNATTYKLNIPHQYKSVYAWYDGKKVGKLNVVSLKSIAKKLMIVPVGSANISTSSLQADLNKIFQQANVNFNVTVKPAFTFNLGNDGLEAADATLMSKYSTEMRALRDAYKQANSDYDKEAYYVFVVNNFNNAELKGYMVRGRALGFVASTSSATESSRLIAHELAHGAFGLEHTFPAIGKNTSANLMDYGTGTELGKVQWEEMQNPGTIISWLDDEEAGSAISTQCNFDISDKFVYSPNGKLFKAPVNSKIVQVGSGAYLVNGYIYGIEINGITYFARIPLVNVSLQSNEFEGFYNNSAPLQLNYVTSVPNGEFGYINNLSQNSYKLYKVLNAQEVPGSQVNGYDFNAGNHLDTYLSNGATVFMSCSSPTNQDLSELQKQLFIKYKNFSVQSETYIYEQGNLVTLLSNGKKYIKRFDKTQFEALKTALKEGKLNNAEAVIMERVSSGYNLSINYGSSVIAKYGGQTAKDASEAALEKVFNQYLKDKSDLGVQHNQEASKAFEDGKKISVKESNIWDLVCNGIKAGKELLQDAEIKPHYWNSSDGGYANNWVNTPPLLSGVGNGVINEIKEIPQLVFMAADIATNKQSRDKLWEGLKGLNLTKIKDAAVGTLTNWTNTYAQGGDVAWHQGGKDGVMVFSILVPTGFLKNADDVLEKNIDDVAIKIGKKGKKLMRQPSWLPNREIYGDLDNPCGLLGVYDRQLPDGSFIRDTKNALEDINFPEANSSNFKTISEGGYKMLNTPQSFYQNADQFWNDYNKVWLDDITGKKANIVILSDKTNDFLKYKWNKDVNTGQPIFDLDANNQRIKTGFCKEIEYMEALVQQGKYKWDGNLGAYIPN